MPRRRSWRPRCQGMTRVSRMTRTAASKERSIVKTSLISASLVAILAAGAAASLAFGQGGGSRSKRPKHRRHRRGHDLRKACPLQGPDGPTQGGNRTHGRINGRQRQKTSTRMVEQLKTIKSDSPDYHKLEAEIAKRAGGSQRQQSPAQQGTHGTAGQDLLRHLSRSRRRRQGLCQRYNVSS